jgi:hypothetical protein
VRVSLEVPLLVSTTGSVELLPTATCPKERLGGVADSTGLLTPVPARGRPTFELDALLAKVSIAESAPVLVGLKATRSCALCPAAMVIGKLAPARENCWLLKAAEETITGPPVALKVADWVAVVPIETLPKLSPVGETVNCPTAVAPVPVNVTVNDGPAMRTLPAITPAVCGAKATASVTL